MTPDSDEHLVRYLLGELPADEAERLDERSITDDEFAERLRVIENDLVDRYARGELSEAARERVDRVYRRSAHLRERVRFAEALQVKTAASKAGGTAGQAAPAPGGIAWRSLAAAAVLLLAASGYLVVRDWGLRDELVQLDSRRASAERQSEQLQQELEQMRAAAPPPSTATFLLRAPRRGPGSEPTTVTVRPGAVQIALRLQVESGGYRTFWVALRDPASGRIVWRSADLPEEADGSDRIVAITVPVSGLAAQRYSAELSGVSRDGSSELIGQYAIRVVLE